MIDENAQKEDLGSSRKIRRLESKKFTQTNGKFKSTRSELAGVCWKSENGESENGEKEKRKR